MDMSKTIRKLLLVSVAATGMLAFASAASAAPVGGAIALKNSAPGAVEQVRWGGHGGWHGHGGGWGWGVGAGLATGAIIGGALAAPYYYGGYPYGGYYAPGPGYYAEQPYYEDEGGDDATGYCMQRFRSYDPRSGTYLGNDGHRHPCP
jgi:hypothetical protein